MNEEKLSSVDVPQKFADWLLAMGCPPEKIPHNDKLSQMCRGQYYMVWRSMMQHVEPKDVIKQKRLQVFSDDVRRYQQAHSHDKNIITPPEVSAWMKHDELKSQVHLMESRVAELNATLSHTMDKVTGKLAQRNSTRDKYSDAQRRTHLLQSAAEQLRSRREHLQEIRGIAADLCRGSDPAPDVQSKLDKCLALLNKQILSPKNAASMSMSGGNPIASSSVVSTTTDSSETWEEQLSILTDCPASTVWSQLADRRMNLIQLCKTRTEATRTNQHTGTKCQTVNTHTALLHCTIAETDYMSKIQHEKVQEDIATAITHLNSELTTEGCELLVLSCEKIQAEARLLTRRELLRDLLAGQGCFAAPTTTVDKQNYQALLKTVDRNTLTMKADLKRMMTSLSRTERKIQKVAECLELVFLGFRGDSTERFKYRELQLDLPDDIVSICDFYQQNREKRTTDLSLKLDSPDSSFNDVLDSPSSPTLTDEINIYLKKLNLESNRKLVLDNGEKIWIFETLQSSISRLHSRCLSEDISCSLICPSDSLSTNLARLLEDFTKKAKLTAFVQALEESGKRNIDINFGEVDRYKEDEDKKLDEIKKKVNENINSLQKTGKVLSLGKENLEFWSKNLMRKYVSQNRTVDSKTYREYEVIYLNYLNPTV